MTQAEEDAAIAGRSAVNFAGACLPMPSLIAFAAAASAHPGVVDAAVQQAARRGIEAAITAALNAYGLPAALNALNQLPAALMREPAQSDIASSPRRLITTSSASSTHAVRGSVTSQSHGC